MNKHRLDLLRCIAENGPVSVSILNARDITRAAHLLGAGYVALKTTLNTSRLSITRSGREKIAFYDQPTRTHQELVALIMQERARIGVRETLDIKHRLNQPKHEQRRGSVQANAEAHMRSRSAAE